MNAWEAKMATAPNLEALIAPEASRLCRVLDRLILRAVKRGDYSTQLKIRRRWMHRDAIDRVVEHYKTEGYHAEASLGYGAYGGNVGQIITLDWKSAKAPQAPQIMFVESGSKCWWWL